MVVAAGTASCNNSRRLAINGEARKVAPVTLPPGLFRLATRPRATGSEASWNTIGIVLVAALAAIADGAPATGTITATLRATKSATRAANPSDGVSAHRNKRWTLR